jgi:integrase/recombinase XerD
VTPRDGFQEGRKYRIRLDEKGGQEHVLPLHHEALEHLEHYLEAFGVGTQPTAPIFRASARDRQLTERPMQAVHAWQMIRRRARAADLHSHVGCHTFRASAITLLRRQGATLEMPQRFADHRHPKTTLLYDRTSRDLHDSEVERIQI